MKTWLLALALVLAACTFDVHVTGIPEEIRLTTPIAFPSPSAPPATPPPPELDAGEADADTTADTDAEPPPQEYRPRTEDQAP